MNESSLSSLPIGSIITEYIHGDFNFYMWIPEDFVGRVVGKKGTIIERLQRETGSKAVHVLKPVDGSLWVAANIVASNWWNIASAYRAISEIVFGEVDDVVLEFALSHKKPSFLDPKTKDQMISAISAKTNTRIYFPDPNSSHNVTLEGTFEDVQRCVKLLDQEALHFLEKEKQFISKPEHNKHIVSPTPIPSSATETKSSNVKSGESLQPSIVNSISTVKPSSMQKSILHSRSQDNLIEKYIEIREQLVGLLLSKRIKAQQTSIMNQIQGLTNTRISKWFDPTRGFSKSESDEMYQIQNQIETQSVVSETMSEEPVAIGETQLKDTDTIYVTFRILGYENKMVELAYKSLIRIQNGERMVDVLTSLSQLTRPNNSISPQSHQNKVYPIKSSEKNQSQSNNYKKTLSESSLK